MGFQKEKENTILESVCNHLWSVLSTAKLIELGQASGMTDAQRNEFLFLIQKVCRQSGNDLKGWKGSSRDQSVILSLLLSGQTRIPISADGMKVNNEIQKSLLDENGLGRNTYIIEADSELTLEIDIMEGNREGIVEMIKTFSDTRTITGIRSIKHTMQKENIDEMEN